MLRKIYNLFSTVKVEKVPQEVVDNISNRGILKALATKYDIKINSVFKLNKILEKMNIIEKNGSGWLLTELGRTRFTGYKTRIYNNNLWHSTIVNAVAEYIKENEIITDKINHQF